MMHLFYLMDLQVDLELFTGPRIAFNCKKIISAEQHEAELSVKISKEIEAGRIAGPFQDRPFPNLRLSPIALVAKKPSGS
jgi:hypothetical protein